MSVHAHEFVASPEADASALSREGIVRRRFERRLRLIRIPEDLTGLSVLDIGAWHGYFSFECERRGAERVLAIDNYAWNRFGMDEFLSARDRLKSKVEHRKVDVHDLDARDVGQFDLVLMLGVFYHLRNPLAALERIRQVTRRLLICETHVLLPFVHERYPLVPFFPGDENTEERRYEMCAMPTIEGLRQILHAAGYDEVETIYTPSFRYWKKLVALVTNRPQSGRGIVHARVHPSERKGDRNR